MLVPGDIIQVEFDPHRPYVVTQTYGGFLPCIEATRMSDNQGAVPYTNQCQLWSVAQLRRDVAEARCVSKR